MPRLFTPPAVIFAVHNAYWTPVRRSAKCAASILTSSSPACFMNANMGCCSLTQAPIVCCGMKSECIAPLKQETAQTMLAIALGMVGQTAVTRNRIKALFCWRCSLSAARTASGHIVLRASPMASGIDNINTNCAL